MSLFFAPPAYDEPMGIGLEEVAYPYPVRFYTLSVNSRAERMAYMDVAPASGATANAPTVVLLHGKNFWGAYWQETINVLSKQGFRVIVPDLLGFGRSSKPDTDVAVYAWEKQAARVGELLRVRGVSRFALVGHSMGGMVAICLAANNGLVTRLVLEDPIGLEDYRPLVPARPVAALQKEEEKQTVDAIRVYRQSYFVRWLPAYERFVEVPARVRLSGEYYRWARVSAFTSFLIREAPVLDRLPHITCPTLVVAGANDRTAPGKDQATPANRARLGNYPVLATKTARTVRQGQSAVLPNCGHIPHIEADDAFHALLLKFLGRGL